jgi:hypothetical protein
MSNNRRTRIINPGSGQFSRYSWAGGKVRVQMQRYRSARAAEQRAQRRSHGKRAGQ